MVYFQTDDNNKQDNSHQRTNQDRFLAEKLSEFERKAEKDGNTINELNIKCDQLEQRLAEVEAIQSVVEAIDCDDDDEDDDDDDDVNDDNNNHNVNDDDDDDDESTDVPAATVQVETIAVQTEGHYVEATAASSQTTTTSSLNGDIKEAQSTSDEASKAIPATTTAAFRLSDFGDDIALLTDPAVRREEELITFKEECARLKEHAHTVEQRLADAEKQLTLGAGPGSGAIVPPYMVYAALSLVVVAYMICSPYW